MAGIVKSLAKRLKIVVPTITPSMANVPPTSITRQNAFYWQVYLKDQGIAFYDIIKRCRYYGTNNSWLNRFINMKSAMFHYGFHIVPAEDDTTGSKAKELKSWLSKPCAPHVTSMVTLDTNEQIDIEPTQTNGEAVRQFARDVWPEWIMMDNVMSYWLDDIKQGIIAPLENILYSDVMGLQTMRFSHGLSLIQIKQLPPEQQIRFGHNPYVYLNPRYGEHWRLAKRNKVGEGLAIPQMLSIMRIMGQDESAEMGLHQLAWMLRDTVRMHKIGAEYKGDPASDWVQFYRWNKDRSDQIMAQFKDVTGSNMITTQHDHTVEFPWPEIEKFTEKLFEGSNVRLQRWGGPLATMLSTPTGMAPYLSPLLRAEAKYEREEYVGPFIEWVLNHAFGLPMEVRVQFSDGCFMIDQLLNEMMKFGSQSGDVSPQARNHRIGLDDTEEAYRKHEAATDENMQTKRFPLFTTAHSTSPAKDGANKPTDQVALAKAKGQGAGSKPGTPTGGTHSS